MEDLRLSEQRYQDSASSQHELPMRAEASIQCSEGQLDQARRQIFQDEVILSHVMESEYLAFAEAYQQHMHAEISSRGLPMLGEWLKTCPGGCRGLRWAPEPG